MTNFNEYPFNEYFVEYQKLGGKKNKDDYFAAYQVFQEETMDIFVFGDLRKHNSRSESLEAVQKILEIDDDELDRLFHSVDNVTAWT
jgi:hypothetical protein